MADEAWSVAVPVGSKGEYLLSGLDPASILNFQYSFTLFFILVRSLFVAALRYCLSPQKSIRELHRQRRVERRCAAARARTALSIVLHALLGRSLLSCCSVTPLCLFIFSVA